jgi:hypothetical protein
VVDVTAPEVPPPAELMDDFYVIALWVVCVNVKVCDCRMGCYIVW